MEENELRFSSILNLAATLRMAAETMRLFSESGTRGSNYVASYTLLSLRIEENASELEDLARNELDSVVRRRKY